MSLIAKKIVLMAALLIGSMVNASPNDDVIHADLVQLIRLNPTLSKYPVEEPYLLRDGSKVSLPFMFEANNMLALEVFVDYEKAKALTMLEGLKPVGHSRNGVKKAKLTINVAEYPRTTTGVFADIRMWFDVQVDVKDGSIGNYKAGLLWWRYFTDAVTSFAQIQESAMTLAGLQRAEMKMTKSLSSPVKTAEGVLANGEKLFSLSFDGTRLGPIPFMFLDGSVLTIVPKNPEFYALAVREEARIATVSGLIHAPVPFDPSRDKFQLFGKMAKDFSESGFSLDDAQWSYSPYYVGMFQTAVVKEYK